MSRPKLWVDIDDVLSQTNAFAIKKLKAQYAIEWKFEDITAHAWETLPGFPLNSTAMSEFWDLLIWNDEALQNIFPMEGAIEAISSLLIHYELHAITARKDRTKAATEKWIQKHFGSAFNSITFIGWSVDSLKKTKGEACIELGVVAMVEDHMTYALTVAEQGIPCYLLPKPWNLLREETHPLVLRRDSWDEVVTCLLSSIDTRVWKSL
jgi:uncharacterized HAD superfamily protein